MTDRSCFPCNLRRSSSSDYCQHEAQSVLFSPTMDAFQNLPIEIVLSIVHLHHTSYIRLCRSLQFSPGLSACVISVWGQPLRLSLDNLFEQELHTIFTCRCVHEPHHLLNILVLIRTPSFKPLNFDEFASRSIELSEF